MMHLKAVIAACVACGCALGFMGGCGDPGGPKPPTGKVHGKVLLNGKPLSSGTVTFVPILGKGGETGQSASGPIESDGTFTLTTFNSGDGAILGQHKAIVREELAAPQPAAGASGKTFPGQMPEFGGKNALKAPKPSVPVKYGTAENTPLKYTVEKGNNDFTIELKD